MKKSVKWLREVQNFIYPYSVKYLSHIAVISFQEDEHLKDKLVHLKRVIRDKFPDTSVSYDVTCRHDKQANKIQFVGLDHSDSKFCTTIFEFFKKRIDELYPLDSTPSDPLQVSKLWQSLLFSLLIVQLGLQVLFTWDCA